MKIILTIFFILINSILLGQNTIKLLKTVKTLAQANNFITQNATLNPQIYTISSEENTLEIDKKLFNKKKGDVLIVDNLIYKIIEEKTEVFCKVKYIFLDGKTLSRSEITTKRKQIMEEYKQNIPFAELIAKYNMDGNKTGELDWFPEGVMLKDFYDAVKKRKKEEIFTIDLPAQNWYYVVLKTFDNKEVKTLTILETKE